MTLIYRDLVDKKLIVLKGDEEKVLKRMTDAFMANLQEEADLDSEVESLIEEHTKGMDTDGLDYRKMFGMIKNKLVRERDIII